MVATSLELGADPRVNVARPERDAWLAWRRPAPTSNQQRSPNGHVGGGCVARAAGGQDHWNSTGGVRQPADDAEYVGPVAADVDNLRGELMKLRATVNCQVPSAQQGLAAVAVAVAELAMSEAVLRAASSGR
jgi:hypothetical protein